MYAYVYVFGYVRVCFLCVCVLCVCAHIVAIRRHSLVESRSDVSHEVKRGGEGVEESVNRNRNDAAESAKHEKDTPTHHMGRAGIRTRAEVKDDTVSDSFPAGDEKEKKRRGSELGRGGSWGGGGGRKAVMDGVGGRGRRDTGRN